MSVNCFLLVFSFSTIYCLSTNCMDFTPCLLEQHFIVAIFCRILLVAFQLECTIHVNKHRFERNIDSKGTSAQKEHRFKNNISSKGTLLQMAVKGHYLGGRTSWSISWRTLGEVIFA